MKIANWYNRWKHMTCHYVNDNIPPHPLSAALGLTFYSSGSGGVANWTQWYSSTLKGHIWWVVSQLISPATQHWHNDYYHFRCMSLQILALSNVSLQAPFSSLPLYMAPLNCQMVIANPSPADRLSIYFFIMFFIDGTKKEQEGAENSKRCRDRSKCHLLN